MSLTKQLRDMWCRFQEELFPEIEAEVGPVLNNHQRSVTVLEVVCPESFIRSIPQKDGRPLARIIHVPYDFPYWLIFPC